MDLIGIILGLVEKYPAVSSVLLVIGTMRAIFKPLMALAHAYVGSTSSKKDDEKLQEVEQSKIYKGIAFVLDYFASIKLPGQK